ncbi:MAG: hypothetical protein LBP76_11705 [Treponema sp.]|jgi:hypothetical protein|nr:hypothetical protein [Treponema sp.]
MKRILVLVLFLTVSAGLFALDWGVLFNQTPKFSQDGFFYTENIQPWASFLFGDDMDLYISGSLNLKVEPDREVNPVVPGLLIPELGRTELTWRPADVLTLNIGRVSLTESSSLIAAGLFDGLKAGIVLDKLDIGIGAYYSGLLYKETAGISLSQNDRADYAKTEQYLSAPRVFLNAEVLFPGILESAHSLSAGGLAQFDTRSSRVDSQYIFLHADIVIGGAFDIGLSGVCGFAEDDWSFTGVSAAAAADFTYYLPTEIEDRLLMGFRAGSGEWNDAMKPFLPVNAPSQGTILKAKLSGTADARLVYTFRLIDALSIDMSADYFFRLDEKTYQTTDLKYNTGDNPYFLGAEIYGNCIWAPFSDLLVTVGGGAFLPQLGNAFNSDAKTLWQVSLSLIISL